MSDDVTTFLGRYENARKILGKIEDELLARFSDEEGGIEKIATGNLLRAQAELHRVLIAAEKPVSDLQSPRTMNVLQLIQGAEGLPKEKQIELLATAIRQVGPSKAEEEGLVQALYHLAGASRAKQLLAIEGGSR